MDLMETTKKFYAKKAILEVPFCVFLTTKFEGFSKLITHCELNLLLLLFLTVEFSRDRNIIFLKTGTKYKFILIQTDVTKAQFNGFST